jgi:uncharacterized protein YdgA (DUF945 family)
MKKIVIVVVVLVLALVVAPWGVGSVAESRLNHGLDKLVEAAPYLKVTERKWTGGWFKSEQQVTFEISGPWAGVMSPKAFEKAIKDAAEASAQGEGGESADSSEMPVEAEGEAAAVASSDAVPPNDQAPQDQPAEEAPVVATPEEPVRFTVRNEVLHGPVLGLSGFGIARVNSHLVLSDETRKKIAEVFGPKDPIEVSTRVGFFGGGTTTVKSEGRKITPKDSKVEITWETLKVAFGYSKNADKYDFDGKWPKLEVKSLDDSAHFVMDSMALDGDGKRVRGDLYDGDFAFKIDSLSFSGKDQEQVAIDDLHYIVTSATKGDFSEFGAKLGTGAIKSKQLAAVGVDLKEVHYDFSARRLHAETLEKMMAGIKAMYAKPVTNTMEAEKIMFAPFKEYGIELLKYDPEFVIDRIGIVTPEGDGYLKGVITLKGATADDFTTGNMAIIGKVHAELTIDVSEKMIQKFPNGSTGAGAAVDAGYAERKGDRLVCKIVFTKGELTVNGKPQAIPGLGGPPPGEGAEVPPPQE